MNKEQQIEEMAHILATTQREDHCGTIAPCQRDCPYYTLPGLDCEMGFCAEALYNSGYRKSEAFSQPHENGGEWISVEDRLPDNHRMVLVVCESTSISAGALIAIGSYGGGFWSLGGADGTLYLTKYMQFVVSHWMELPEMPKMKGGK